MKVLLLIIGLIPVYCAAQITTPMKAASMVPIGKIEIKGVFIAQLSYYAKNVDTTYSLQFHNQKYTEINDIQSIVFAGVDNACGQLYTVLKSAFLEENKNKDYMVVFKLGDNKVSVSSYKIRGNYGVMFLTDDGYFIYSESQIDKLFGK